MFNINLTALIVFASFIVFMLAMKQVFFDPLMAIRNQRDKKMQDDRRQAESLSQDCALLHEQYALSLKEAHQKSIEIITQVRSEATRQASEQVTAVRHQTNTELDAKMAELSQWREETYQSLAPERDSLRQIILSKITQTRTMIAG